MASDQQVALSRTHRMETSSISKTARQVVPAFLQKLYELRGFLMMVNDPRNSELIRWSDAGDSFFVLDHERFAHEVLGRWFKHRNFSSFVRQLNMYGFHKIPHLQQGVLKSDTDTEFWNFAHTNFHRGQPDLLCLIQRKKQVAQPGEENLMDMRDPASSAPGSTQLSSGQILDINSIVNGITAIKRHQTTISAELNELKRSNQLLWQDALAARAKHQKQQDTINRIVKFLAGVFGHHPNRKEDTVEGETGHAHVIPRRTRLMIEDARRDGLGKGVVEVDDPITPGEHEMYGISSPVSMVYPTIDTPGSAPSPSPSVAISDNTSTPVTESTSYNNSSNPSRLFTPNNRDEGVPSDHSSVPNDSLPNQKQTLPPQRQTHAPQQQAPEIEHAVTPSKPGPPSIDFDPRVQGVLNQLSPSQIQQLLSSLASQTISDLSEPSSSNTVAPYQPGFEFPTSGAINPLDSMVNGAFPQLVGSESKLPSDDLISFDHFEPSSPQNRADMQWQATEDIDKDVNALNSSINSLIQTFGLDPSLLDPTQVEGERPNIEMPNLDDVHASVPESNPQDFDLDSFLNTFSINNADHTDYSDMASTAFLDEVPSPSDNDSSPMAKLRHVSPEINMGAAAARKRKSDLADLDGMLPTAASTLPTTAGPGGKPKKRRDK